MKLTYATLKTKSSLLKSATGLSLKEFDYLLLTFIENWQSYNKRFTFEGKPRERARKYRKNSTFKDDADLLIFILYDYRHNPTQEFMGLHFNMTQPKVAAWLKVLDPLLERSLKKLNLTPLRDNVGLNERLIESVTVLFDGSERPINRPLYDQKEFYSGKKNNTRSKIT
jgi:hypothetical protein